jgi:alkanesulfonate monooxygenase SsuD/methylene tetrahydromethanopterin reductase-like flavin-dependent oxidoreductase (luciferase family)
MTPRPKHACWRRVRYGATFMSPNPMRRRRTSYRLCCGQTRAHMMHVRAAYNPADFTIDPAMLNPWADPVVGEDEAVRYVLATGSLYGSPPRVRDQVAELRDAGVQHLLCQTGFGDMSHDQNLASMRRFGAEVMPAFRT